MEELDNLALVEQVDRQKLSRRAANRTGWFDQARADCEQAIQELHAMLRSTSEAPRIGLWLGPELQGVGALCRSICSQNGVNVHPVPLFELSAKDWGLDLILAAGQAPARGAEFAKMVENSSVVWDISRFCSAEDHPVQTLAFLVGLILQAAGRAEQAAIQLATTQAHSGAAVCRLEIPTVDNPAKQAAVRLLDRLPLFWRAGWGEGLADDWAMRQLWYAERMALAVTGEELVRLLVMARFPRYWPNTALFVEIAPGGLEANGVVKRAVELLQRRRFATMRLEGGLQFEAPVNLTTAAYWLEWGEWLALYSAFLYHVDPADRIPLALLFGAD